MSARRDVAADGGPPDAVVPCLRCGHAVSPRVHDVCLECGERLEPWMADDPPPRPLGPIGRAILIAAPLLAAAPPLLAVQSARRGAISFEWPYLLVLPSLAALLPLAWWSAPGLLPLRLRRRPRRTGARVLLSVGLWLLLALVMLTIVRIAYTRILPAN